MDQHEFLDSVQQRAGVSADEADRLTRATLGVLADRITGGAADDLAAQLPRGGEDWVSERAGVGPDTATRGARAVLSTVRRAVTSGEFEDVLAQLPREFGDFID